VDTGWTDQTAPAFSAILSLWGLADVGSEVADQYALSMSYTGLSAAQASSGLYGLAIRDEFGNWINAALLNFGGMPKFVSGPWQASYGVGTYGVDPATSTAWAVLNYTGRFAVAQFR
jgi:hypothetical protein